MAAILTVQQIIAAARTASENGHVTFGFVGSADPGLNPAEYVVVPFGASLNTLQTRDADVADPVYHTRVTGCLLSDAATVDSFAIPDELKPFVAANRAHAYACGYLTNESVVEPAQMSPADQQTAVNSYLHMMPAANMAIDVGTLASFFTTVNYFKANHNTGGSVLPINQIKALRTTVAANMSVTDSQLTRAVYLAGHASDKRLTLRSVLNADLVSLLKTPTVYAPVTIAKQDAWAALRTGPGMSPAGTAVLGLLKVVLTEVAKLGLIGIAPGPQAISDLKTGISTYKASPAAFHPGARFLFGVDPVVLANVENLKVHLGTFGGFCEAAGLAVSVTSSPHVAKMINERKNSFWYNLGKNFSKGVEANTDVAKAAVMATGTQMGQNIPNPITDGPGYEASVQALAADIQSISLNL